MIEIVNLLVRGEGYVSRYETQRIPLVPGDYCLVESDIGIQLARVMCPPRIIKKRFISENEFPRKVIRKALDEDLAKIESIEKLEREAFEFCLERIEERGMTMKLIKVISAFDRSRAIFMFTAEGRVDFRDLVRDLAHRLKTRIEMRQIGVRDEARLMGGIGNCGLPLCCLTFLKDFHPVSIKMAKDQGLSLIPSKISGLCGRLMCCLQYEHAHYADQIKTMPKVNKRVTTPRGDGKVKQLNILKSLVMVELADGEIAEFKVDQIKMISAAGESEAVPQKNNSAASEE
ncbi:stage 0 sporulation protein [bacterium]|nr:stage 0 sporulation protein [candidate division CSSED10-310 bacterium]